MITKLAKRWLERRGYYIVVPGACEMVLSGFFRAAALNDKQFMVDAPMPNVKVVALNHTFIALNSVRVLKHG